MGSRLKTVALLPFRVLCVFLFGLPTPKAGPAWGTQDRRDRARTLLVPLLLIFGAAFWLFSLGVDVLGRPRHPGQGPLLLTWMLILCGGYLLAVIGWQAWLIFLTRRLRAIRETGRRWAWSLYIVSPFILLASTSIVVFALYAIKWSPRHVKGEAIAWFVLLTGYCVLVSLFKCSRAMDRCRVHPNTWALVWVLNLVVAVGLVFLFLLIARVGDRYSPSTAWERVQEAQKRALRRE